MHSLWGVDGTTNPDVFPILLLAPSHPTPHCLQVVPLFRDSVNMWRDFVPLVQYLRNGDMKDRHWAKVNEIVGTVLERGDKLTLQGMLDLKVSQQRGAGGKGEASEIMSCCKT